ncbi:hypothetical protein [Undibacterium sp. TJN19]|uniref:hypothetical protein n=1 Tax=Undibacterium sp. TJN19 TaxID=3413055 RepID=UPI003BF04318
MLKVEASAMAMMDTNLVMKTKMKGDISHMLPSEIGIAPATPDDLIHRYQRGGPLYLKAEHLLPAALTSRYKPVVWMPLLAGQANTDPLRINF